MKKEKHVWVIEKYSSTKKTWIPLAPFCTRKFAREFKKMYDPTNKLPYNKIFFREVTMNNHEGYIDLTKEVIIKIIQKGVRAGVTDVVLAFGGGIAVGALLLWIIT